MTASLWAIVGSLGLGAAGLLLAVIVLYGRAREGQGRADERLRESSGDAERRAEVAEIQGRRHTRDESLRRLRRLSARYRRRTR